MKNNLTPTRIVDKNGKLTTVYKASRGKGSRSSLLSSTPKLPASNYSARDLAEHLYPQMKPEYRERAIPTIDRLNSHDPSFTDFVMDLTSRGPQAAQRGASAIIKLELTRISSGYAVDHKINRLSVRNLRSGIARSWNIGSVMDELGLEQDSYDDFHREVVYLNAHLMESGSYFLPGEREDNKYWRGVMAIVLANQHGKLQETINTDLVGFIPWAGEHEDIGGVIEVAKERNTLNVSTIREIMALNTESTAPLRNGNL